MSKNIALVIARALLNAHSQVAPAYPYGEVAIAVAFEIEGWDAVKEIYGELHAHASGFFTYAFQSALESAGDPWEDSDFFLDDAMGCKRGTVLSLQINLPLNGHPSEKQAIDFAAEAEGSVLKCMQPLYGAAVWSRSEFSLFVNEPVKRNLGLSRAMGQAVDSQMEPSIPTPELDALWAQVEAAVIEHAIVPGTPSMGPQRI